MPVMRLAGVLAYTIAPSEVWSATSSSNLKWLILLMELKRIGKKHGRYRLRVQFMESSQQSYLNRSPL